MTYSKWLSKALLGGAALAVMASGVRADELSDLKAKLASLQSQVDELKARPADSSAIGGISFERGQGSLANWGNGPAKDAANVSSDNGFTIAITPTADMPAPVAEVVVYGYVKGDVIYDREGTPFREDFEMPASSADFVGDYTSIHALQSRFGIKSKVDTAVGQIRTKIEGDFFGSPGSGGSGLLFRMRHAYGEWDMTPNWTLLVGQTDLTGNLTPIGITLVDFFGPYGFSGVTRRAQVRVTYHDGPISWAVAVERPELQGNYTTNINQVPSDGVYDTAMPNLASYIQYDIAGGHQVIVAGTLADIREEPNRIIGNNTVNHSDIAWQVSAGVNINLADMATLTAGGVYTQGLSNYINGLQTSILDVNGKPQEAFGTHAGVIFNVNETTTVNVGWSYGENVKNSQSGIDHIHVVSGNVLWQPVKQIRMGWEAQWGQNTPDQGKSFDDLRFQFGTWFFF